MLFTKRSNYHRTLFAWIFRGKEGKREKKKEGKTETRTLTGINGNTNNEARRKIDRTGR